MKRKFLQYPRHTNPWITMPDGTGRLIGRMSGVRLRQAAFKMEQEEFDALVSKVGIEAATKMRTEAAVLKGEIKGELTAQVKADISESETRIKGEITAAEKRINEKSEEVNKGMMTMAAFTSFKEEELAGINEKLAKLDTLETALTTQGNKMNEILEKASEPKRQSFEEYFMKTICGEKGANITKLKAEHKFVEISLSTMKDAGVTSISNVVQAQDSVPTSPYLPGIGGAELLIFDILRDPNFILDKVDLGRTDQSRIAWINETGELGLPAEVDEAGPKPLIQNTFKVEQSFAKKMAAYIEITEEFDQDLPQLATLVRRMLQERVGRAWDDAIQAAVYSIATAYSAAPLVHQIPFANFWDVIYAMMAQVRVSHFIPNSVSIHPYTNVKMQEDKTQQGLYLLPPFKDEIVSMLTQANKVSPDNALVGDLKQYKVDIYKEFVLKVGWINDNFINNKFCVLGEIRYHRYISDNRKAAIVKGNLGNIRATIDGGSGS